MVVTKEKVIRGHLRGRWMAGRSVIAVLVAVAIVALLVFGVISRGNSRLAVGETAPSPTLRRLEGPGTGSLKEYRGRWVLVDIWASWCIPCREEAPALEKFQREHGGNQFTVVGIDTQDVRDDGARFARQYELSYPQLHDGGGGDGHEFGTTGVPGVPENYLLEPNGRLAWSGPAAVDARILEEDVAPFLPPGSREASRPRSGLGGPMSRADQGGRFPAGQFPV
jgi:cytochrome c biogenesis protein CcmG, thiol:disulfide interchange protein DsbE